MLNKLTAALLLSLCALSAHADLTTTYYGDNDGFGVGATAGTINPNVSNQGVGEAPLTDLRLIGNGTWGCSAPGGVCGPFNPTGTFGAFSLTGTITSAILTLRTGSFDSATALDAPNRIFLDGVLVDPTFINGFSSAATDNVETRSFVLDASFFPLLADGLVSLSGTHLSEAAGSGSFQVDFMSLDITTDATVPEPTSIALLGLGLLGLGFARRKTNS